MKMHEYTFIIISVTALMTSTVTAEQDILLKKLKMAEMDLVFLDTYEEHFLTHGTAPLEQHEKAIFMNYWVSTFGEDKAKEVLIHVGLHWSYAMDIARTSRDLTTLVVALHARVKAFNHGLSYLAYTKYFLTKFQKVAESCRNVASHLMVFSHLGTEELVNQLKSVLVASGVANNRMLNYLEDINIDWQSFMSYDLQLLRTKERHICTPEDPGNRNRVKPYENLTSFQHAFSYRRYNDISLELKNRMASQYTMSHFFAEIMFGKPEFKKYKNNAYFIYWLSGEQHVFYSWIRSQDMNKELSDRFGEDRLPDYALPKQTKCFIIGIVRRLIIRKARCDSVDERLLNEDVVRMKQQTLIITIRGHINGRYLTHNIQLDLPTN